VQGWVDREKTNGQDGKINGRIEREREREREREMEVQTGRQEDWFIYFR